MLGLICLSLVLIALGLLSIFARDFMWEITEWSNSNRGVVSERTDNWETMTTISGVGVLILGICVGIVGVGSNSQQNRQYENATATVETRLNRLDATYAPIIPTLRADARNKIKQIDPRHYGLPADADIYYGLCPNETFFIVIDYGTTNAEFYLQHGSLAECSPGEWTISQPSLIGRSEQGGQWYRAFIYAFHLDLTFLPPIPTPTPEP